MRLATGHDLAQEWFVLALGPGLAVTLCGLDGEPGSGGGVGPAEEGDRMFEVIWSFDPAVARDALDVVLAAIAESAPDRVDEIRGRVAATAAAMPQEAPMAGATDRLTAGLMARVESVRRRERLADRRASAAKTEFLSRIGHELLCASTSRTSAPT